MTDPRSISVNELERITSNDCGDYSTLEYRLAESHAIADQQIKKLEAERKLLNKFLESYVRQRLKAETELAEAQSLVDELARLAKQAAGQVSQLPESGWVAVNHDRRKQGALSKLDALLAKVESYREDSEA